MILSIFATNNIEFIVLQSVISILFVVLGFFLVRYIKSIDVKLSHIINDVNNLNITTSVIDNKQSDSEKHHTELKILTNNIYDKIDTQQIMINSNTQEIIKLSEKIKYIENNLNK